MYIDNQQEAEENGCVGISVREAMQWGGLARCKVVAGEAGLDRIIDSVTIMEVPDVIRWLNGNVLLLTSLYPIKEDEKAIRSLVPQLVEAGNSALAVKTQAYVDQIPEWIIQSGNRWSFPIIEIPNDIAYLDIMTPLMPYLLHRPDPAQSRMEDFFQWLKELALGGKGIPDLTNAMEQMTGNPVTVGSELVSIVCNKGMDIASLTRRERHELIAAKRPIRMQRLLNNKPTPCIVAPLLWNEEVWGDITCWQTTREFIEQDYQILDRAMTLIALEFHKLITKSDLEQSLKNHFLTDLLLSRRLDKAEALDKGSRFGWDLSRSYQVVCIRTESSQHTPNKYALERSESRRRLMYKLNSFFRLTGPTVIVTEVKEFIVILLPREMEEDGITLPYPKDPLKDSLVRQMEAIREQLAPVVEETDRIHAGIGRFYGGLDGIHKGYEEAVKAISLGTTLSNRKAVHFEDLGIYRLLHSVSNQEELKSLHSETVGRLDAYDSVHESELTATLKQYFECNGSISVTAKKQYVHVNTIKYRLQKIEQLTGCSVHDSGQQLLLHMGLKMDDILKRESNY